MQRSLSFILLQFAEPAALEPWKEQPGGSFE